MVYFLVFAMWQWSGWTSQMPSWSIFHSSREVSMHRLSAAEAAGGTRRCTQWWVATPRAAVLWSLSLWQSRPRQPRHCCRHLLHQKVICYITCEQRLFLHIFCLYQENMLSDISHIFWLQSLASDKVSHTVIVNWSNCVIVSHTAITERALTEFFRKFSSDRMKLNFVISDNA